MKSCVKIREKVIETFKLESAYGDQVISPKKLLISTRYFSMKARLYEYDIAYLIETLDQSLPEVTNLGRIMSSHQIWPTSDSENDCW